MFADPQSVTVNAVPISLPRVGSTSPSTIGSFRSADGNTTLDIRQNSSQARFRREVRLSSAKVAADPVSAVNKQISTSIILVVDEPKWGFSDTELGYLTSALVAYFTNARRDQLLGGEL
jgi:hypothetical protein